MRIDGSDPLDIPAGWDCVPLDQLVDTSRGISYGIVQPGQPDAEGVPIVRVNNVRNGRIDTSEALRVDRGIESKYERTRLRGGEVLLSLVGTLGQCAVVPEELRGWNVARAISVIPLKPGTDARWVSYCLRSSPVQALMRGWATTTVQATLNLRDVRRLPILMAPKGLRGSITETVSALDDKIEQNRRTARALERLARAIFRAWFVDFEPVKAKAAGAVSFPSMPQPVFDALPTRFVDFDIGPVPEGWEVKTFGDVFVLAYGKALKAENRRPGPIPVYGSNGQVGWHNEAIAPGPGIVVGRKGNPGTVEWANSAFFPIDTTFFVKLRDNQSSLPLLYHQLLAADLQRLSTDSAVPGINRNMIYAESCITPDTGTLGAFDRILYMLWESQASLEAESSKLAELRDYLLPKLLSGQVRVEGANG